MIGDYTFTLDGNACNPIYADTLRKSYTLEADEVYYKVSLNGTITFVREDFEYIMSKPFNTKFLFNIYHKGELYFAGQFTRTDCQENIDDSVLKVNVSATETVDNVLTSFEKETDIVALKPELDIVTLYRRPITQHYMLDSSEIYCSVGGSTWVQSLQVDPPSETDLLTKYGFTSHGSLGELYLTRKSGNLNNNYLGSWYLETNADARYVHKNVSGIHILQMFASGSQKWDFFIRNNSTGMVIYHTKDFVGDLFEFTFTFENVNNTADSFAVVGYWTGLYSRTLVALPKYNVTEATLISGMDLTSNNRNYKYVIPGVLGNHVAQPNTSVEATAWGRTADGQYFQTPNQNIGNVFPIKQNNWRGTSMWINLPVSSTLQIQDSNWRRPFEFKDAYILESVIDLLLKQINPTYTFKRAQSQFLYNWRGLGFNTDQMELYLTQKTNILRDGYDQAAQRGLLSLKQVLDMLWQVYQCKWHMVDNKLYIEHISYYLQGNTYIGTGAIEVDLTSSDHARHNLPMTFAKGQFTYDKTALPEEIQYAYGEPVSEAFQSGAIVVQSPLVEKGKSEKNTLSLFNPDIDSLLLNSENAGNDGFVLLSVDENKRAAYRLFQYTDASDHYVQNGYLSYRALYPVFFLHNLPDRSVKINGIVFEADSIRKTKKQDIWFSYAEDLEPTALVKTQAGAGRIEKMDINLTSRRVDLTLQYDTY